MVRRVGRTAVVPQRRPRQKTEELQMSYTRFTNSRLHTHTILTAVAALTLAGGCASDRPEFEPMVPTEEETETTDPDLEDAGDGISDTDRPGSDSGEMGGLGAECSSPAECDSGYCVDGVCCLTACSEVCARCDAPGSEGSCVAATSDDACGEIACQDGTECRQLNPVDEANCAGIGTCAVDTACEEVLTAADVLCQDGTGMCDGDGECIVPDKLLLGEACSDNDECGSGACVSAADGQMRCCEDACDGICEACSTAGRCEEAPPDDAMCEVITCPDDTPCATYPAPLTTNRCTSVGRCATEDSYCQLTYEPSGTECGSDLTCDGSGGCTADCVGTETWCTDECVDTDSDAENCGECDEVCGDGLVCSDGECVASCNANQVTCGNSCVDPLTNANNCGASGDCTGANAGTTCTSPSTCVNGSCEIVCSIGQVNCDGTCIDPNTNATYCGATAACTGTDRGAPCATANGYACVQGVCRLQCSGTLIACDGICINPTNNEDFCGASNYCEGADRGDECASTEECTDGACKLLDGEICNEDSDCVDGPCTQFYFDDDGDGYHSADVDSMKLCGTVAPSSDWSTEDLDCCDTNATVNPDYDGGPTETPAPGCGNSFFDYNCDGVLTPGTPLEPCGSFPPEDCPGAANFSSDTETGPSPWCGESGGVSGCAVVDGECAPVVGAAWTMECY